MKNVSKKNLAKYNHFHSNWNNMQIIRAIPTKAHRVSGIFEGFFFTFPTKVYRVSGIFEGFFCYPFSKI